MSELLTSREVAKMFDTRQSSVFFRFAAARRVIDTAASGRRIIRFDREVCSDIASGRIVDDGRGLPRRVLTDEEIDDYNRRCPFRRDILEKFLRALERSQDRRTTFDRGMRINRRGAEE